LRPSASPSSESVASTQRFQRGFISRAPLRNSSRNANSALTKSSDSDGAAESSTRERKYVCQSATEVSRSWRSNSCMSFGSYTFSSPCGSPVAV
jgi:hypothetical protein